MQIPVSPRANHPATNVPAARPAAARRKRRPSARWVALLVAAAMMMALGGTACGPAAAQNRYALPETPPQPYMVSGEALALAVDAPDPFLGADDLRAYFAGAADFAEAAGANTLIFDAKQGACVWWRDGIFPTFEGVAVQDDGNTLHDPMAILCEVLEGRALQLWLSVDPYAAGDIPYNAEGAVAELAAKQGAGVFAPGAAAYEKLLAESLSLLPRRYPIGGFVMTGTGGASPVAATNEAALAGLLSALNSAMTTQDSLRPVALAYAEGELSDGFAQSLLENGTVSRLLPAVAFANPADGAANSYVPPDPDDEPTGETSDGSGAGSDTNTSGESSADGGVSPASGSAGTEADTAESGVPSDAAQTPAAASHADIPGDPSAASGAEPSPTLPTLSVCLAAYDTLPAGSLMLLPPAEGSTDLWFFGGRGLAAYGGGLLGHYPGEDSATAAQRASLLQPVAEGTLPTGFAIPQILGVNYPAQNARVATAGLFIMGTSDPAQPLLMDGEAVPRYGTGGAFGIGVALEEGENSFTFTQGDKELTLHVERSTGGTGGGGGTGGSATPPAAQQEAEPGQAVRVTALIASALTNPDDDSSINETFHNGAVLVVEESVRTWRGGLPTWAYKLKSGDYILAKHCEWVDGDGQAVFTSISVLDDGRGEWLTFEGSGAPAGYVAYSNDDGTLTLTFYDTTLALPEGFASGLVSAASVVQEKDHVVLTLHTSGIWGYSLEYAEGQARLYLKKPPAKSADAARPLAGVQVLLDPGHGDTDVGAPGIMGEGATPNEKDANLALAQTIAWRLRQLGAEVSLTRETDAYLTLDDRLAAQTLLKPDFFISVHHNSMPLTQDLNHIYGTQVYYYHPYNTPISKQYAQNLIDAVAPATGRPGGAARWSYFYVTRTTVCPSVLFEYGFMINPAEFEQLTSIEGLYAAALATADGIVASLPQ